MRKPRLEPIRFFHIPANLQWIYDRAKEKQSVKDALRKRRFKRKKEKTIETVVIQVIEIPEPDLTPKNVVEVKKKGMVLVLGHFM